MSKLNVGFICVHNACRSQMAEALGRHLAGATFNSFSAGTTVAARIDPQAARTMADLYQLDLSAQFSKPLAQLPALDIVITMGCEVDCPMVPCRYREDWGLADPTGQSSAVYRACAETIAAKILDLQKRIQQDQLPLAPLTPQTDPAIDALD